MNSPAEDFLGHPKGLYVCFTTEMWERFSFYGMKYLLLLYLTKHHLFSDGQGLDVLGAYAGLVYALPVVGGLFADRYLGARKAVIFGGILLVIGHSLMTVEGMQAIYYAAGTVLTQDISLPGGTLITAGTTLTNALTHQDTTAVNIFYLALAFIVAGVGFLKPNISVIVGNLYPENDPRRDSGFTIFYMGINIGSVVATLACGWLGETYGWRYGFGLAGIGMMIGLLTFTYGQKYLQGFAEAPNPAALREKFLTLLSREHIIYLATIPTIILFWFLVQSEPIVHITQNIFLLVGIIGIVAYSMLHNNITITANSNTVLLFSGFVLLMGLGAILTQNQIIEVSPLVNELVLYTTLLFFVGFIGWGYKFYFSPEFSRTVVLMVLIVSSIIFWSLFEQSAGSMMLYADRVVDREVNGFTFVASQFAALNPAFVVIFAIPFALLWPWLSKRNLNPSTPVKFAMGIIQVGLGFAALVIGAKFPDSSGKVAAIWLVLANLLHSTGELCLSPIGLSAVTKLSISKVVSVTMGTWFVATALSETLAFRLSKLAAIDTKIGGSTPLEMLANYTSLFEYLMWIGIGFGIIILIISPLLKKGMHGVH
ncbi:MAG: peptide MFS transporter [Pseudomonadota bacterium]